MEGESRAASWMVWGCHEIHECCDLSLGAPVRWGWGQLPGLLVFRHLHAISLSLPESQHRCLFAGLARPCILDVVGDSHAFWLVFVGFTCSLVAHLVPVILCLLSTNACPAFRSDHWPCSLTANLCPLHMQRNELSTYFLNGSQNFVILTPCTKSNILCHSQRICLHIKLSMICLVSINICLP